MDKYPRIVNSPELERAHKDQAQCLALCLATSALTHTSKSLVQMFAECQGAPLNVSLSAQ